MGGNEGDLEERNRKEFWNFDSKKKKEQCGKN
jgi:hypothetical protein